MISDEQLDGFLEFPYKKLNWKQDLDRKKNILIIEKLHDNPREIIDFESLYMGEKKTEFGICNVMGHLTGGKSFRIYIFPSDTKNNPTIFGMGAEEEKENLKIIIEYMYTSGFILND